MAFQYSNGHPDGAAGNPTYGVGGGSQLGGSNMSGNFPPMNLVPIGPHFNGQGNPSMAEFTLPDFMAAKWRVYVKKALDMGSEYLLTRISPYVTVDTLNTRMFIFSFNKSLADLLAYGAEATQVTHEMNAVMGRLLQYGKGAKFNTQLMMRGGQESDIIKAETLNTLKQSWDMTVKYIVFCTIFLETPSAYQRIFSVGGVNQISFAAARARRKDMYAMLNKPDASRKLNGLISRAHAFGKTVEISFDFMILPAQGKSALTELHNSDTVAMLAGEKRTDRNFEKGPDAIERIRGLDVVEEPVFPVYAFAETSSGATPSRRVSEVGDYFRVGNFLGSVGLDTYTTALRTATLVLDGNKDTMRRVQLDEELLKNTMRFDQYGNLDTGRHHGMISHIRALSSSGRFQNMDPASADMFLNVRRDNALDITDYWGQTSSAHFNHSTIATHLEGVKAKIAHLKILSTEELSSLGVISDFLDTLSLRPRGNAQITITPSMNDWFDDLFNNKFDIQAAASAHLARNTGHVDLPYGLGTFQALSVIKDCSPTSSFCQLFPGIKQRATVYHGIISNLYVHLQSIYPHSLIFDDNEMAEPYTKQDWNRYHHFTTNIFSGPTVVANQARVGVNVAHQASRLKATNAHFQTEADRTYVLFEDEKKILNDIAGLILYGSSDLAGNKAFFLSASDKVLDLDVPGRSLFEKALISFWGALSTHLYGEIDVIPISEQGGVEKYAEIEKNSGDRKERYIVLMRSAMNTFFFKNMDTGKLVAKGMALLFGRGFTDELMNDFFMKQLVSGDNKTSATKLIKFFLEYHAFIARASDTFSLLQTEEDRNDFQTTNKLVIDEFSRRSSCLIFSMIDLFGRHFVDYTPRYNDYEDYTDAKVADMIKDSALLTHTVDENLNYTYTVLASHAYTGEEGEISFVNEQPNPSIGHQPSAPFSVMSHPAPVYPAPVPAPVPAQHVQRRVIAVPALNIHAIDNPGLHAKLIAEIVAAKSRDDSTFSTNPNARHKFITTGAHPGLESTGARSQWITATANGPVFERRFYYGKNAYDIEVLFFKHGSNLPEMLLRTDTDYDRDVRPFFYALAFSKITLQSMSAFLKHNVPPPFCVFVDRPRIRHTTGTGVLIDTNQFMETQRAFADGAFRSDAFGKESEYQYQEHVAALMIDRNKRLLLNDMICYEFHGGQGLPIDPNTCYKESAQITETNPSRRSPSCLVRLAPEHALFTTKDCYDICGPWNRAVVQEYDQVVNDPDDSEDINAPSWAYYRSLFDLSQVNIDIDNTSFSVYRPANSIINTVCDRAYQQSYSLDGKCDQSFIGSGVFGPWDYTGSVSHRCMSSSAAGVSIKPNPSIVVGSSS